MKMGENTKLTLRGNLGQIVIDFPQPSKIISAFQLHVFQQIKHTCTFGVKRPSLVLLVLNKGELIM